MVYHASTSIEGRFAEMSEAQADIEESIDQLHLNFATSTRNRSRSTATFGSDKNESEARRNPCESDGVQGNLCGTPHSRSTSCGGVTLPCYSPLSRFICGGPRSTSTCIASNEGKRRHFSPIPSDRSKIQAMGSCSAKNRCLCIRQP